MNGSIDGESEQISAAAFSTNTVEYLGDGGETGSLMRAYNWAESPLGPVEEWPHALKTAVRIVLTSRYAMWLGWGDQLIFLYNDSYARMTLGKKHPWALGKRADQVWAEIWGDIGPRIEHVIQSGEATWDEALLLFLERNGYPEETYHTFSYSPLSDDTGKIAGMLCVVTEETERVIGERRLGFLREVGVALTTAGTEQEVFAAVGECLESQPQDFPFTLSYLFDADGKTARLITTTGVPSGHSIAVPTLVSDDRAALWPSVRSDLSSPFLVEDLADRFSEIPVVSWDIPARQAIVVPLAQQGQDRAAGVIIAGLNPYRPFDADYRGFIRLFTGQVEASLSNARANEEERKRATALAELDRAKTAFFTNISHEFRTPLTLMLGPIEDALGDARVALPAVQRERLQIAHRNTVRLLKLANNLLDFTRIEAGRMQASFQPTDLAILTADVASSFRAAIERAGLRFEVDCAPLREPVYVDHDLWEKIVLNLLSNAFKYTMEGGISVTLIESGGRVMLTVRDTGMGIPEKDLPRVFERFHRVEGNRGRTHEGTGIGLALVQELVKLHGGEVRVESAQGKGTAFIVSLPFGTAHLPAEHVGNRAPTTSRALSTEAYVGEAMRLLPEPPTGRDTDVSEALQDTGEAALIERHLARILVADDNADMRAYITHLLSESYAVDTVSNGFEALDAVQANRPDLIISDVMMPAMDGFELLSALRSNTGTSTIPVILLSARAGEDARVEGIHLGADDYLVKPFSKRELQARVTSLLQLVRLRRQATEAAERLIGTLERERMRLIDLFMQAPAFMAVLHGPDHVFALANPAYARLIGHRDIIGKSVAEALPELEGQGFVALLDQVYRTGEPYVGKDVAAVLQTTPEGPLETRILDFIYQQLLDADHSVLGVLVHGIDLTERKRLEVERERLLSEAQARAQREALVNQIGGAARAALDPTEVMATAVRALGEALGADRCYFANYDRASNVSRVGPDWSRDGLASIAGIYRISDYIINRDSRYQSGETQVVADTHAFIGDIPDPVERASGVSQLDQLGVRSLIRVQVQAEGLVSVLAVAMSDRERHWTDDEVRLVETIAAQTRAAVESARIQRRERNIATHLQEALQPPSPPSLDGLALASYYRPALSEASVGGDFFDVFAIDSRSTALVVADLSGKGLAAAQQVATVKNMLRFALYKGKTLAESVGDLHGVLVEHDLLTGFATLFVGMFDRDERTLTYVNCGQEPGMIWRAVSGDIELMSSTGPVLGGFNASGGFDQETVTLDDGDVLALFTDGLTDVGPSRKQLLGVASVSQLLSEYCAAAPEGFGAQDVVDSLIAAVDSFGSSGVRDDIALLVGIVSTARR